MSRRLIVPALATFVSLVILLSLGAWQWRRMGEKQALISTIQTRLALPPQAAPSGGSANLAALEYAPVVLRGSYAGKAEAHVFFSLSKPVGGYGGAGYLVLTPFRTEQGEIVLVNRGFIPQHLKDPASRPQSLPQGPTEISGLLRLPEKRNAFSGADDPAKNIYYVRDPAAIARGIGMDAVVPYIVDLRGPAPAGTLPVPGVTQIDIPNNHFQYALTWWALAAVLAAIFAVFVSQQRRN